MNQPIEARIKQAAEKVLRCEQDLDKAQQEYDALIDQAHEQGVEVPRTALSNPFMKRT